MSDFLTMREAGERLGIPTQRIKQLWADDELLRVDVDGKPMVPALCLEEVGGQWMPLESVRGTVTMLRDAGFSTEEATRWMLEANDDLDGAVPLECLASHRVKDVRNAVMFLAF